MILSIFAKRIFVKTKGAIIVGIIVLSLLPVYVFYKYLQRVMRPKESGKRLVLWLLASFALIFAYTFLVVFLIKMIFPEA